MSVKTELLAKLNTLLEEKIRVLEESIQTTKESRDSDGKSSAGDKYETGRAMMQIEQAKLEGQLAQMLRLRQEISQIDGKKKFEKIEFGSLANTSQGNYFLSVGLGKLEASNGQTYFAISFGSPIGRELLNKKEGEQFTFQGRSFEILSVE